MSDVLTVPEAGRKLGLGKNAAYAAAARGEIPVIRIGRLLKVPKIALTLILAGEKWPKPTVTDCSRR